jgi:hypothetical protein
VLYNPKLASRVIQVIGALLSLALCSVTGYLAGQATSWYIGVPVAGAVGLAGFLLAAWLSDLLSQTGMMPEQRRRRRLARHSVRIYGFNTPGKFNRGWVAFSFENPTFATEFCRVNAGQMD